MALALQTILLVAFFSSIIFFVLLAKTKLNMEKNDRILSSQNIEPQGSNITHGMIRRPESRGVIGDSKPSLAWYVSLLK